MMSSSARPGLSGKPLLQRVVQFIELCVFFSQMHNSNFRVTLVASRVQNIFYFILPQSARQ